MLSSYPLISVDKPSVKIVDHYRSLLVEIYKFAAIICQKFTDLAFFGAVSVTTESPWY